jgi:hypothetical protein
MAVLVVNQGIIKSISMVTAGVCLMMKLDVETWQNCFCKEVKWKLAILSQLSTITALDLCPVHHVQHAPLWGKHTYSLAEGNQGMTKALWQIQSGGDHRRLQYCPFLTDYNRVQPY